MAGGLNRNITVRLLADTSNFTAGMAKVSGESQKAATTMEAAGGKTKLITTGVAAAGVAATALGVAAIKMAADFDASMSTVQANTGASADEMAQLRQAAIDAGADTVYSATESADAINELGKAGLSTSDILSGGLSGALNLAASDGMAVGDAAELMATTLRQFNLTGAESTQVADALAAGAGKAVGSAHDLGLALNQAGMVSHSFGISMQETTGTLAAFAQSGMIGSDAGTSLKTMLISLANPSTKASNLMQELGINAYDAQGKFIGLSGLAGVLKDKLSGLSQEQRNQALATIFGTDAIRAANVLYEQGAEGIDDWTKAVSESGFAAQQAAARNNNLKGDIENLSGSFESLMISLGEGGQGPLRSLVQTLDTLVDGFSQLPAPVQQGIVLFTALAGGSVALHKAMAPLNASSSQLSKNLGMVLDPGQRLISMSSQLYTGATQIGAAFSNQSRQLEVFGSTVSRTSGVMTGLETMGSSVIDLLGGPWGMAITAAGLALFAFAQDQQAATQRVDELTQALQSGQSAAEYFNKALSESDSSRYTADMFSRWTSGYDSVSEALDKIGIAHSTYIKAIQGEPEAILRVREQADSYRDSLGVINQMWDRTSDVAYGVLSEQQGIFEKSAAAAKEDAANSKAAAQEKLANTLATSGLTDAQSANADATQETADAQSILQDGLGATTDGINEQATALGEVIDALGTYYGFALSSSNALISMHDSFDKATESVQKNGKTLDLNTEQGRANQSALNDLAESALKAAEAQSRNGEGLEAVNGTLDLAREKYIAAAQAMGMTPEAAEAAANAAGLTKDKFDQLATSVNSIPGSKAIDVNAHTEPAKNSLTDLGMTVAKLPTGEIKIDGDNTQARAAIAEVNGIEVDKKTGVVTMDKNQYDTALALANGATIDPKTGYLLGDNSDYWKQIADANGWTIDPTTGYIYGNNDQAMQAIRDVNNATIADKYFTIHQSYVDESGGTYSSSGYRPKGAMGNIPTAKTGGLYTGYGVSMRGYAGGGRVIEGLLPGKATYTGDDNITLLNARVKSGEFVSNVKSVGYYGADLYAAMNRRQIPRERFYKPSPMMLSQPVTNNQTVNQTIAPVFQQKIVRPADDMYTAASIMYRNAAQLVGRLSR